MTDGTMSFCDGILRVNDRIGCGCVRIRGLLHASIEGLLIAAGQNLKRFLDATG